MGVNFTRRNRLTGNVQRMARAAELGIDAGKDGGKWATVCEAHNAHVLSATLALACGVTGLDYCDECRKEQKAKEREAAKADKAAKA
jgi:hypothetical protein